MKDCCKSETQKPDKKSLKKYFIYAVYIIIVAIVIGTLISQISNDAS